MLPAAISLAGWSHPRITHHSAVPTSCTSLYGNSTAGLAGNLLRAPISYASLWHRGSCLLVPSQSKRKTPVFISKSKMQHVYEVLNLPPNKPSFLILFFPTCPEGIWFKSNISFSLLCSVCGTHLGNEKRTGDLLWNGSHAGFICWGCVDSRGDQIWTGLVS